jgi:hypothetical protein
MLETHIVMSLLIFRLVFILVFRLALTLMLHLALLLMPYLISLMDLTIAHMVLVHERTAFSLYALVTAHVLIMVIVSCVGLIFLLEGLTLTLNRDTWMVHVFPHRDSGPTRSNGEVLRTVKTSSGHIVKCWIPKIYLTNPSIKPSTSSHPM